MPVRGDCRTRNMGWDGIWLLTGKIVHCPTGIHQRFQQAFLPLLLTADLSPSLVRLLCAARGRPVSRAGCRRGPCPLWTVLGAGGTGPHRAGRAACQGHEGAGPTASTSRACSRCCYATAAPAFVASCTSCGRCKPGN